jgi:MFS family permease
MGNMFQSAGSEKSRGRFPILLVLLIFLSMLPVTMIVPVLKEIVKDNLQSSSTAVAWFMSIAMLGSFLFSPLAGFISDRLQNRKTIIGIACFLDAGLFLLLTVAKSIPVLLVLRFLEGSVHIFVIGLLLGSVSDRENHPNSPWHRKGVLMGIAGMFLSLGAAIGLPLGAIGKTNPFLPFYIGAIIFIFIGLASFFFLKDELPPREESEGFVFQSLKDSFKLSPFLILPFAFHFIDRFTVGFVVSSFNLHMREVLEFTPGKAGFYMSLVLLPMSLLSYPSARIAKVWGILPLVLGGSFLYGIFLSLVGWTVNPSYIFLFLVTAGVGAGMMYVPSMILASRLTPTGFNATVMSAFTGLGSLGFMSGPVASDSLDLFFQKFLSEDYSIGYLSASFGFLEIFLVLLTLPILKNLSTKIEK